MRIFALLSWYDEKPEHLLRCVTSLKGFADAVVALDGPYETFPGADGDSPAPQHWALSMAYKRAGLAPYLASFGCKWGGEVEKRARLFDLGREAGATPEDWFLIIDADMELAAFTPEARDQLAATALDVAQVRWHDVQIDGKPTSDYAFRSMFRALPGLTVERTHWLYLTRESGSPRFLWHLPSGHIAEDEPALDLRGSVTLHHYNSSRDPERRQRAMEYYQARDAAGLEAVGDFK